MDIAKQTLGGWSDYLFQTLLADIKTLPDESRHHMDYPPPLVAWGHPGVGKSSGVHRARDLLAEAIKEIPELANEEVGLIDVRFSQFDAVDLRGVPTIVGGRTSWSIPDWLPRKGRDPKVGIIFTDELFLASPSVLGAGLQFTLDRRLGDYRIPPLWYICAASNRVEDKAGVPAGVNAAQLNRFEHREIISDVDGWIDYAIDKGLREEVIGFIRFRGNDGRGSDGEEQGGLLVQYPNGIPRGTVAYATPRTWEWVSNKLNQNLPPDLEAVAIEGLIGTGPAAEFRAFLSHYRKLGSIDLEEIASDPEGVEISEEPSVVYAITTHLARNADADNLGAFIKFVQRTSPEYAVKLVGDATRKNPELRFTEAYLKFKQQFVDLNTPESQS